VFLRITVNDNSYLILIWCDNWTFRRRLHIWRCSSMP